MLDMRGWWSWLLVSAVVIALDQTTKYAITQSFRFGESVAVTAFFNVVLAYNTGAAFSLFAGGGGWQRLFFIAIAAVAAVAIVYLLRKHQDDSFFSLALALILGGALGNLIDRIAIGKVVDFLDFFYGAYHWPAFNVADSAITVGALLLAWDSFKKPKKQ